MIAVACFVLRANRVLCFWMAYILTRPFGAAGVICSLSQPRTAILAWGQPQPA